MKFWNSRRNFFATVKSGKTTIETSIRYEWRWKKNSSLSNIKFNPINSILLNHRMNKQNPIKYINFPPPPFSRRKGKKISIINNRYVTRNKFNPVIFPSQVSNKISHRLLYIYFHTWFKFRSCHEKSHFSSLPLFLHPPPPLRRNHRFQYPSLPSLYTRRWSIYRTKRREPPPCLILTEEKERESKRESESEKERERESARSYISSGFEVSHRSSDEDARKRAERIKGDYKLCPCYPRWKRLWIFYVGGGAISIGFSRHSRGHSIKNSVKPVLTNGAQRYQLPVWKSKTAEEDDARRGEDSEELNEISPRIPGWMKRYIYIYIYSI